MADTFNIFKPLTKPVEVYDPTRSVQANMSGQGTPSAQNIAAAYQTPRAQLQMQQGQGGAVAQQQAQPLVQQQQRQIGAIDKDSPTSGMEAVMQAMYTDPKQEEKMRKASVANQRIMAVADALRHIGNIYNTVRYAPSQKFNNPVTEEYERYQKGKALRDAANARYLSYLQARAAQDAKAKQLDAEQDYKNKMLLHYQDQDRRLWERDAATTAYHEGLLGLRREKQKLDDDYRNKRIGIDEYNARSRRISALASAARASGSGSRGGKGMDEYTVTSETQYTTDPNTGERTGSRTTKTRTVNRKDGSSQTSTTTKSKPAQPSKKKALPGQTPAKNTSGKKKLPGM